MQLTTTLTDAERVLRELQRTPGEWVPDLYARTHAMVHSRVADLRAEGHVIEVRRFGAKDYRYRIVAAEGVPDVLAEWPEDLRVRETPR